jgi:hypothetical protein
VRKSSILRLTDYPAIEKCLMTPPLGGTRAPYLQALPGQEDALRTACQPLEGRYFVADSREMLDKGLFGAGERHPEAAHRIGTLILLPYGDETFHRKDPAYFTAPARGDHDALSAEEMTVPLLMWDIEN